MGTGSITQEASLVGSIHSLENLSGTIFKSSGNLIGKLAIPLVVVPETEERTVTPSMEEQEILPSKGKYLSKVTVGKIPNNYGLITYNGYELTVS